MELILGAATLIVLVVLFFLLQQAIAALQSAVRQVETRVVESASSINQNVSSDIAGARSVLQVLAAQQEERKRLEDELRDTTRSIEAVIVGSRSRGVAGESILAEAFKHFPPGLIETNFRVNGKPVEYALVLANRKRLAIDSKWPKGELLRRLAEESDAARRTGLINEINQELVKKAREVSNYIQPSATLPWAIAAVPDAAFAACPLAHSQAFKDRVILMPYGMTISFVLALYNIHSQYSSNIDTQRVEGTRQKLEQDLDRLERLLENSIAKGARMVTNGYNYCRTIVADMKRSVAYLRVTPDEDGSNPGKPTSPTQSSNADIGPRPAS